MDKRFRISIFISLSFIIFILPFNSVSGENKVKTWDDFISDYEDTDNDGEEDDFKSFYTGDFAYVIDVIDDFTDYEDLGISIIKFKSNKDEPLYFGNTLDDEFKAGDKIHIWINIDSGYEEDGDKCELYDAYKIMIFEEVEINDGGSENDIAPAEATMSTQNWIIFCTTISIPFIIIFYFMIYRPYFVKKKTIQYYYPTTNQYPNQFYNQYQNHNVNQHQTQSQTQICPECYHNSRFVPEYQKWFCDNCDKYI